MNISSAALRPMSLNTVDAAMAAAQIPHSQDSNGIVKPAALRRVDYSLNFDAEIPQTPNATGIRAPMNTPAAMQTAHFGFQHYNLGENGAENGTLIGTSTTTPVAAAQVFFQNAVGNANVVSAMDANSVINEFLPNVFFPAPSVTSVTITPPTPPAITILPASTRTPTIVVPNPINAAPPPSTSFQTTAKDEELSEPKRKKFISPFSPEATVPLPTQLEELGNMGTTVWKRNERERHRVRCVNDGYAKLRNFLPLVECEKRLSKVDTLRLAIHYIRHLEILSCDISHELQCNCFVGFTTDAQGAIASQRYSSQ